MPIYEYHCKRCKEKFELLVRSFAERTSCPKCGSEELERLFSLFAMGSGSTPSSGSSACNTCSSKRCDTCA